MAGIIGSLAGLVFASIPIVWIVMHYKSQTGTGKGLTDEESRHVDELLQVTDNMAERIKTLEAILDTEYPDWRERHDKE
jgi:phage shock protein B